ncbi:LysR family transcriptional regulator [Dyella humicola]|uniref:LysR family transcriptional regulator n=1 Tax=Dyella humicola TaxID=2992126 RepID=UPI00225815CC|nr:LysR family transcriptional regulator [Dyella humicola]
MDRFDGITTLLAAVDAGSLSAASRQLRIPLPTVSRRVADLEEQLKVRLLLRGHRSLTLTEAGRSYVASCRRIMEDLAEAERTAIGEYHTPRGELVFSVPLVMGLAQGLPVAAEFLRAYPDIRMRVQLVDRIVNLLEEHVDVALRVGVLPDSSLVATRVGMIKRVLCASPEYLKEHGKPTSPEELSSHHCVGYETITAGTNWDFHHEGRMQTVAISPRIIVNSIEGAVVAATAGVGIARVLSYQIEKLVAAGALVQLLEAHDPPAMPVSLIYPEQRQVPLKLRAFLDFAIPRLRSRLSHAT